MLCERERNREPASPAKTRVFHIYLNAVIGIQYQDLITWQGADEERRGERELGLGSGGGLGVMMRR